MPDVSQQWQRLAKVEFACIDEGFLEDFRQPGSGNKFVAWNPFETSSRHFKSLLLHSALSLSEHSPGFFEAYAKLENRHVGRPLTVRYAGCDADADYLAAVEEWDFLRQFKGLDGVESVVEIGGGFGRTYHALLTLCPGIEQYSIIDLAPMLELSRAYLGCVLRHGRVEFIRHDDGDRLDSLLPDLVINIDSFQEMPPPTVAFYMTHIVQRARKFYCKNPVGKYAPSTVGLPGLEPEQINDVFQLGYCRDIVDIFDDVELAVAREAYLKAYCPPPVRTGSEESEFRVAASRPMDLFPYFLHVLYVR